MSLLLLFQSAATGAISFNAEPATFTLSGIANTFTRSRVMNAVATSFTQTGFVTTLASAKKLTLATNSFTQVGILAILTKTRNIISLPTTYSVGGVPASTVKARNVIASAGVYNKTGANVTFSQTFSINANNTTYNLTGYNDSGVAFRNLPALASSYSQTGVDNSFRKDLNIYNMPSSYNVGGISASFAQTYTLDCSFGSYSWNGSNAALVDNRNLVAAYTSYTYNGVNADLSKGASGAFPGSYNLNGSYTSVERTFSMGAYEGSIVVTGFNATFEAPISPMEVGSYTITGFDSSLFRTFSMIAMRASYNPGLVSALALNNNTTDWNQFNTVTVYGNPTYNTGSKFGSHAIAFDGTEDCLLLSGKDFAFGSGDFTIDFWIRIPSSTVLGYPVYIYDSNSSIGIGSNGNNVRLYRDGVAASNNHYLAFDTFIHMAVEKWNGSARYYYNGTLMEGNPHSSSFGIDTKISFGTNNPGNTSVANNTIARYDAIRVRKVAAYKGNFTLDTADTLAYAGHQIISPGADIRPGKEGPVYDPLVLTYTGYPTTSIKGKQLIADEEAVDVGNYGSLVSTLLNFNSTIEGNDYSSNTYTYTQSAGGGVSVSSARRLLVTPALKKASGINVRFYESTAFSAGSIRDLTSSNFTVEMWIHPVTLPTGSGAVFTLGTNGSPWQVNMGILYYVNTQKLQFIAYKSSASDSITITSTDSVPLNTWTHIALVRNGNTFTIFVNGVSNGSAVLAVTFASVVTRVLSTATSNYAQQLGETYIDSYRITKAARYLSNFIPQKVMKLSGNKGNILYTNATLIRSRGILAEYGTYSIIGNEVEFGGFRYPEEGSFSVTGYPVNMARDVGATVNCDFTSFVHTGVSSNLAKHYVVNADAGSISLIGADVAIYRTRVFSTNVGSITLNGAPAEFVRTRLGDVLEGFYAFTGFDVEWHRIYVLDYIATSYDLVGNANNMNKGFEVRAYPTDFTTTGFNFTVYRDYVPITQLGNYNITGYRTRLSKNTRYPLEDYVLHDVIYGDAAQYMGSMDMLYDIETGRFVKLLSKDISMLV